MDQEVQINQRNDVGEEIMGGSSILIVAVMSVVLFPLYLTPPLYPLLIISLGIT